MNRVLPDGWNACSGGEIRRLSARLSARRQRRAAFGAFFGVVALVATAAAATAVTYHIFDPGIEQFNPGPCLNCPPKDREPAR